MPLLVWGTEKPTSLPKTVSATHVYNLILDGVLPAKLLPVTSSAWPHMRRCYNTPGKKFCSTSAAIWNGTEKLLFMDDKYYKIDLATDPTETNLEPLTEHPRLGELKALAKRVLDDRHGDRMKNQEVLNQLKALGYME